MQGKDERFVIPITKGKKRTGWEVKELPRLPTIIPRGLLLKLFWLIWTRIIDPSSIAQIMVHQRNFSIPRCIMIRAIFDH